MNITIIRPMLLTLGLVLAVPAVMSCSGTSENGNAIALESVCTEHRVSESVCTRCNPELIPSFKASADWCAEHGVPESQCSLCHADLVALGVVPPDYKTALAAADVCTDHRVPASVCTRCNPDLVPAFEATVDWCAGHGVPESQCSLCHADLAALGVVPPGQTADDSHEGHDNGTGEAQTNSAASGSRGFPGLSVVYRTSQPSCPTDQAIISFASAETVSRAGIRVEPVVTAVIHDHFEAPAEVVFDQNTTITLSSSLPVNLLQWLIESGDGVGAGDALAIVESPDMALLQGDYLEAWSHWQVSDRNRQRSQDMVSRGLIDSANFERSVAEATGDRARWVQTESRLRLAGLAEVDLKKLQRTGEVSSRFRLRASRGGVLLDRYAPLGRVLDPGEPLARIGDPSALWIEGHLRERDADLLRAGQIVEFTADGSNLDRVTGTIIWISSFLDPHSRTATVRVRPNDHSGTLRANEFGRLHLPSGDAEESILIPEDAVQWEGCCNVVFVQEAADRYRPQKVNIAPGDSRYYRVLDGLSADDRIVVQGSFLLKTELKKSSIGAGCCGLEAS